MADEAQLAIIKKGVNRWNKWRKKNSDAEIDLSRADLVGITIIGIDLSGANLNKANLVMANLCRADLSGANLAGADLCGANLSRARLSWADLSGADLSGADLSGAVLDRADLSGADLRGAHLSGAHLSEAVLFETKLTKVLNGVDLSRARLMGADLSRADLSGAHLSGARLNKAVLFGAKLTKAFLDGADLSGADLMGADLMGANLSRTNLRGAVLDGAVLDGADLSGAILAENTTYQSGGVNVDGISGDLNIGGDIVGRDKIITRQNVNIVSVVNNMVPRETQLEFFGKYIGLEDVPAVRYANSRFEAYCNIWKSLQALRLIGDDLWEKATLDNLAKFAIQWRETRLAVLNGELFFEDNDREQLFAVLDSFGNFRVGKTRLVHIRSRRQPELSSYGESTIKYQIEENHRLKLQYEVLLDQLRASFKQRLTS